MILSAHLNRIWSANYLWYTCSYDHYLDKHASELTIVESAADRLMNFSKHSPYVDLGESKRSALFLLICMIKALSALKNL